MTANNLTAKTNKPAEQKAQIASKSAQGNESDPLLEQTQEAVGQVLQRAAVLPNSIKPADGQRLQRLIGNRAVGHLNSGTVRRRPEERQRTTDAASASFAAIVNRTTQLGKAPNASSPPLIQAKLTLGPVGDKYEQEADQVAKQVVGSISSSKQPNPQRQEEEEELQMKPISSIQRQEEEELQMKPISSIQRQEEEELQMQPADSFADGPISGDLESQIQGARGGGQPLADPVRTPMEQAFGADFSSVKVHTGSQSDTLNRSVQARAFTTGSDIFFRQGEYSPGSSAGQELLAHELTHTIQQGAAPVQRQPDYGQAALGQEGDPSAVQEASKAGVKRKPSLQRHQDEMLQRHSDSELAEQIEEAKLQEETIQTKPDNVQRHGNAASRQQLEPAKLEEVPQVQTKRQNPALANRIQRHLIPLENQEGGMYKGTPNLAMIEKLRQEINGNADRIRTQLKSWMGQQPLPPDLKLQKETQVAKLEWKSSLQKMLDAPPARADGDTGTIWIFARVGNWYTEQGEVREDFVKSTMVHEAFHTLSANHSGFQDTQQFPSVPAEVNINESIDEAYTEQFSAEVFHQIWGGKASYTTNYWIPGNRWTGDLGTAVQEITKLSRDEILASYLANPETVSAKYIQNLVKIRRAWEILKAQERPKAEDRAQAQITEAVKSANSAPVAVPSAAVTAPSTPTNTPAPDAQTTEPAPATPAADPAMEDIFKYLATLPERNGMPKTLGDRKFPQMIEDYNEDKEAGARTEKVDILFNYSKWKEAKVETPVNDSHVAEAAKRLGWESYLNDYGINILIPTQTAKLGDPLTPAIIPRSQSSGALKREFSTKTIGTIMGMSDGDPGAKAAEIIDAMGGGGYEATTATIVIHPKHNDSLAHYVHEFGHLKQHQQGYTEYDEGESDDMPRKKQALLLDYHNIVVNENPGYHLQQGGDDPTIRVRYTDEPKEEKMSEAAEKGKSLTITPLESFSIFKASSRQMSMLIDIAQVPLQYSQSKAAGLNIGHYILNNLMVEARKKSYDVEKE